MGAASGGQAPQSNLERLPAEIGQQVSTPLVPSHIGAGVLSGALALSQGASVGGALLQSGAAAAGYVVGGPIGSIVASTIVSAVFGSKKGRSKRRDARATRISINSAGTEIPFYSGRAKVVGIPFYGSTNDDFPARGSDARAVYMGRLTGDSGKRNQFALLQYYLGLGEFEEVVAAAVEGYSFGSAPAGSGLQTTDTNVMERMPYGVASNMAQIFTGGQNVVGRRDGTGTGHRDQNSKGTGKTFVTVALRRGYKSDDVTYPRKKDPPILEAWCKSEKLLTVTSSDQLGPAVYSANPSYRLLSYLLNDAYGPKKAGAITVDDVSLPHARKAAEIADVIVRGPGRSATNAGMYSVDQINEFKRQLRNAGLSDAGTDAQVIARFNAWVGGLNLGLGIAGYRAINQSTAAGAGGFFGALTYRQYECHDRFESGTDWLRSIIQIIECVPDAIVFWTADRKLAWDFPNAYRTAAQQSVGTLTDDDLLSAITFNGPDPDDIANRGHLAYDNVTKFGDGDQATFPRKNSVWDIGLKSADNGVPLVKEFSPFGIGTEPHAKSWLASTLLHTRRWFLSFDLPERFRTLAPGDIVRVNTSILQRYDRYVRIHRVSPNSGEASVKIIAKEFEPDDYKFVWDSDDPFDFESFAGYRAEPVTSLAASAGTNGDIGLSWVDDSTNILDAGFDIETKFSETEAALADADWVGLATINNDEISQYSYQAKAGWHQHRIRKFSSTLIKTAWTDAATAVELVVPPPGEGTSPKTTRAYPVDKTLTSVEIGATVPEETPASVRFTIAKADAPNSILETITDSQGSNGYAAKFEGLERATLYVVTAQAIYSGEDDGDVDTIKIATETLQGYEVIGISRTEVKAQVPDAGSGQTYYWEYYLARGDSDDDGSIDWQDAGTSTVPFKTISAGSRANQAVTVRCRTSSNGEDGNWVTVGTGFKFQSADAPSPARNLTISQSNGVFTLGWDSPATIANGHRIYRYGCRLVRDGVVEERLGAQTQDPEVDADRTRTTLAQLHSGKYYFEVSAITIDGSDNLYYADNAVSQTVDYAGQTPAVVSDADFTES